MPDSDSKTGILQRIRRRTSAPAALPELDEAWITFPDRERQFAEVLASVGWTVLPVSDPSSLDAAIRALPCFVGAAKIIGTVPGVTVGNCDLDQVADPHELADVDVAIVSGEFAVAENGAVWVAAGQLKHRALCCIAQHLVLVVPRMQIVHTMHEAYQRLSFGGAGYGLFVSGPSKTADIEQSLVIGAHGARSLTVVLAAG
jgi:L-lactate dehydrogenase complex protein LldG